MGFEGCDKFIEGLSQNYKLENGENFVETLPILVKIWNIVKRLYIFKQNRTLFELLRVNTVDFRLLRFTCFAWLLFTR